VLSLFLIITSILFFNGISSAANGATEPAALASSAAATGDATIPPGTVITAQNWQQYRQFMPDGMIVLFEGQAYWKMPADVSMPVGPTVINPLPPGFLAATEKFGPSTKVVELPEGGLTIEGYQGGVPFLQPEEPHKGWKILADFWYRYMPHIVVNTPDNQLYQGLVGRTSACRQH
jgi:hypothetical protein